MNKFNRYWHLKYYTPLVENGVVNMKEAKLIEIGYPLKLDFSISRNTFSNSNKATLNIYNLGQGTRDAIFQDYLNIERWCFVELYAGYGTTSKNLPLLLKGKVLSAYSEDRGQEVITKIDVIDNGILDAISSHTFEAGTPIKEVYDTIAKDMQFVEIGSTGNHEGVLDRPLTVNGNSLDELNDLTGGHAFIDNGRLNILHDNEVLGDYGIYKLTSDSGLLGMPRRKDAQIEIDVVFAPEIAVGQLVEVESIKDPLHFNGQYKVIGISHQGAIGGAEGGAVKTTLNLFAGTQLPNSNWVYTQQTNEEPLTSVTGEEKVTVNIDVSKYNIKDVYNYILRKKVPPTTKITKNISWMEALNYNNLKANGAWTIPTMDVLSNLAGVSDKLQKFIDTYYPGSSVTITSGWRPVAYNSKIGGATKSRHITGKALDFSINGKNNAIVGRNLSKFWKVGYIQHYSGWQHVDISGCRGVANDK